MHVDEHDPLTTQLDSIPQVEPPPDLKPAIMESVRRVGAPASPAARFRLSNRAIFAAGWAAAAAIVLVFLTFVVSPSSEAPFATMAPLPQAADVYEASDVTVTVHRRNDLIVVEPRLTGGEPVTITVRWERESAAFAGISGVADASSQNNQMTFTLASAAERPSLSLGVHPSARTTEVQIWIDEREVIRARVPLEQ